MMLEHYSQLALISVITLLNIIIEIKCCEIQCATPGHHKL